MSRKTKDEAEKTRTRILASALSLFARKGYEHTTFTDIAARLNMTKGAVYWHFTSKEGLLKALVDLALERFRRQLESFMPVGDLTFLAVADMMVRDACVVVAEPRSAAFFRLMKCQIKWSDDSMSSVREELLNDVQFGPREAFKKALANDAAQGRIRQSVDAEQVATVCLAIWDGLVQARLDGFLRCDMEATLRNSYDAIWRSLLKV